MQRGTGFCIKFRKLQGAFIPTHGRFRHSLIEEALGQPGIGLHQLREGMPAVCCLAYFLEFADCLVKQAHLTESNTQVVMRFRIFVCVGVAFFKLMLQLAEHVGEIDANYWVGAARDCACRGTSLDVVCPAVGINWRN